MAVATARTSRGRQQSFRVVAVFLQRRRGEQLRSQTEGMVSNWRDAQCATGISTPIARGLVILLLESSIDNTDTFSDIVFIAIAVSGKRLLFERASNRVGQGPQQCQSDAGHVGLCHFISTKKLSSCKYNTKPSNGIASSIRDRLDKSDKSK